jgi:antitoxin (DNA-binding transcriptional repressor) of toxin-antitoxin stability system
MSQLTVEEAQGRLGELIDGLTPGEGIILTRGDRPVARLVGLPTEPPRPVLGRCKGMLTILSDDDEHLKDWAEYLP